MFPALSHNLESAQRVQTSAKGCMRGIFHGELYGEESPNVNQFLPGTRIRNFSRTSPDPVPLEGPPPPGLGTISLPYSKILDPPL